jgi:hypothetical protein
MRHRIVTDLDPLTASAVKTLADRDSVSTSAFVRRLIARDKRVKAILRLTAAGAQFAAESPDEG